MKLSLLQNVYDTNPQEIDFKDFLKLCGNKTARKVQEMAHIDDEKYRKLKATCPAVMFSTAYSGDVRDDATAAAHFNGFVTIDIDHCLDIISTCETIASWPETCLCGESLSGSGVYAVLKAPETITGETYADWYSNWLVPEMHNRGVDIDTTSCNVSRLRIIPVARPRYITRGTPIALSDGGKTWEKSTFEKKASKKAANAPRIDDCNEEEQLSLEERLLDTAASLEEGLAAIDAQVGVPALIKRDQKRWFEENYCQHSERYDKNSGEGEQPALEMQILTEMGFTDIEPVEDKERQVQGIDYVVHGKNIDVKFDKYNDDAFCYEVEDRAGYSWTKGHKTDYILYVKHGAGKAYLISYPVLEKLRQKTVFKTRMLFQCGGDGASCKFFRLGSEVPFLRCHDFTPDLSIVVPPSMDPDRRYNSTMLYLDFETRSDMDIKKVGGVKYARHCQPILLAYALGEMNPPRLWNIAARPEMPPELKEALDLCTCVCAHNAQFDRQVFEEHIAYDRKNELSWRDTMILAYAHGLPGALADLCDYYEMGADEAKDKEGKKLIKKFCSNFNEIDMESKEWEHFCEYCRQDVTALRALYNKLPTYNDTLELWSDWDLDYHINGRGIPVDRELAKGALKACEMAATDAACRCRELTDGLAPTQTTALLKWCHDHEAPLASLGKADIDAALADEKTPPRVKEVLEARLEATKSSTKKFQTMLDAADDDGRVRGTLQFYGASHTGRFAGRLLQTQNCPRPTLHDDEIETAIQHFYDDSAYEEYGRNVSKVASSCIRAALYNGDRPFTICDYSSIENRVLAWFAGENWKLKAFEEGQDLYVSTYNKTFNANITKQDKSQRQIGKIMELALGYQGAVGSFLNFAKMYNVDLTQLPTPATRVANERLYDPDSGLDRATFGKVWQIILGWRKAHPATTKFWANVADLRSTDKVKFFPQNGDLLVQLPSGRYLCYAKYDAAHKTCFGQIPGKVGYFNDLNCGSNILLNNIVQGTARDLLCNAIRNCEAKGWRVLFHVHDEIIVDGCPSVEALQEAMCDLPSWAAGLPVSAAGEQSYRYTK